MPTSVAGSEHPRRNAGLFDLAREKPYTSGMDASATWRKPPHVLLREVGGEAVLLDLETEKYFGLDEVGTFVLQEVERGSTLGETVAKVLGEYDAPEDAVRADVETLLLALTERGLLRAVDNG